MNISAPFKALLSSRKFWLSLLGAVAAIVLYLQGSITADQLVDAILVLVGVLVTTIALEDAAEKNAQSSKAAVPGQMMVGGDSTIIHEAAVEEQPIGNHQLTTEQAERLVNVERVR